MSGCASIFGAWMRSAAAALRGGGKLLLVDIHPLYTMIGTLDPLVQEMATDVVANGPTVQTAGVVLP